MRDPRYDILFEPVKVGPVTAPNRFFQVPHCSGMGWQRPRMLAAMRSMKAQGGWGVVCTEYCSIHPSSDDLPHPYASLWDDTDIEAHRLMTDQVHAHGALAGVELWYGGARTVNLETREFALDVASLPSPTGHPFHTRAADRSDIKNFRRWHREAALRAKRAGFDIVYVYATHGYFLSKFLSRRENTRCDEYGGSLENRVRLVRELIEETKDTVADRCAVAVRFAADETIGVDGEPVIGERRDMFGLLAELPDLWDINIQDYSREMGVSRFVKEGALEPYMAYVKSMTSKPVVTVGRFTSPDTMVSQIKRGIVDFIGAARPSIADPFLPRKIEQGDLHDIRECIGCNICYAVNSNSAPIRCTQNPTMGEEWRRGWHPEKIEPRSSDSRVLIVGAGPAGLEAARALGKRGYRVMLAEATRDLGGRVSREASLPGLGEWARVRDYRVQQLEAMPNVEIFRESRLTPDAILDVPADHIAIATGARWHTDWFNGESYEPIAQPAASPRLLTPDDIMDGELPEGPALVVDCDHYYMASVIAERLRNAGLAVHLATPADKIAAWSEFTAERSRTIGRLSSLGVGILTNHDLKALDAGQVRLQCNYTGRENLIEAACVVIVGRRRPNDDLYHDLKKRLQDGAIASTRKLARIGDCLAPGIIASAVYSGHRYARELDCTVSPDDRTKYDKVFYTAP